MKLSLCITTYNEEQNVHYPLDSAYDFVDEVVIVDGGSTDKTVEIAKSYGKKVKVYIEDNPPMFHINKQKAIERAKGEWILQLDADEALSRELKEEINSIVISNKVRDLHKISRSARNDNVVAYWLARKNFFLTRFLMKGGQYPDYTIRLYRKGFARFPCKDVHENVTIDTSIVIPSDPELVEGESRDPNNKRDFSTSKYIARNDRRLIGYLKNPILHYADPDFSRYLKRWDRYTSLEAMQLINNEQLAISNLSFLDYFFIKPALTFFSMYFRHLGFMDGFPGFVFALFSSIRFWAIYIKLWQKQKQASARNTVL